MPDSDAERHRSRCHSNWGESRLQVMLGYRRIEPLAYYVSLTKEQHLVSLDFEVIQEPWRWRP